MIKNISLLVLIIFLLLNCSSSRRITRLNEKQIAELSSRWNDTDSKLTSAAMVYDLIEKPWIENFVKETGKDPVILVGNIGNKSNEDIETSIFIKDIEHELFVNGKVKLAASADEREQWRLDNIGQQTFTSNETGANFLLIGTISSLLDNFEGKRHKFFKVNLELIELESNSRIWAKENQIKKSIVQEN